MIRRIVTAIALLGALAAAVVLTGAASDEGKGKTYKVEFDNAFGLTEGGDVRVGGVKAGQSKGFTLSKSEPQKAVVEIEVTEPGFESFRTDSECQVRQQSLIGEYFVDCQQGNAKSKLKDGATIPVSRTASIIPTDLINNVLRRPYRERLRLIIAELGTGLAGRPDDLAATLKRAHPGLRETTKTLRLLGDQKKILQDFVADSDTVVKELADRKEQVSRFVKEAGETAAISASRKSELRAQFNKLPTFLDELEPYMVELGRLADEQIPLLGDLRAAAPDLEKFFEELGPFAEASRPAIRSLGEASVVGREAFRESADEIAELRNVARGSGQVGKRLRQFLQSLDNKTRAIETDERASNSDPPSFDRNSFNNPRNSGLPAKGFSGMEALINYFYWQTLGINSFDNVSHYLRFVGVASEGEDGCSPYTVQPTKAQVDKCSSFFGPRQPGLKNLEGVLGPPGDERDFGPVDCDPTEPASRNPGCVGASGSGSSRTASASDQSEDSRESKRRSDRPANRKPKFILPPGLGDLLRGAELGSDGDAPTSGPAPDRLLDFLLGP